MHRSTAESLQNPDACAAGSSTRKAQHDKPQFPALAMLEQVIHSLPQAISWKDRSSTFLGCNRAFASAVGLENPADIVGKPNSEVDWVNGTLDLRPDHDRLVMERGQAEYHVIQPGRQPDGQHAWFDISRIPLYDETGSVIGVVSSIEDATDRYQVPPTEEAYERLEQQAAQQTAELQQTHHKLEVTIAERAQAELALRESEARLRALVDNLPFDFWACDANGRYIMQNLEDIQHWGNLLGKRLEELDLEEDVLAVWQDLNARVLSGEVVHTETHYQLDDGQRFCVTIMSPVRDETGIHGLLGVNLDVTEQKQIEATLRQNEERLRLVLQSMPIMMDAFDEKGVIIMWNSECERVTGYSAEEIIGNPQALDLLYPDPGYRDQMLAEWTKLGNNFRNWEWQISCKDGSSKTIIWSNISDQFPVPGWAGWGVGVDITDKKQTEEALRQSEWQLREQAQRERLLNHLVSQIRNSLDFDTILETVLQEIQSFVEADRCQFAWYHPNGDNSYWESICESHAIGLPSLTGRYPSSTVGPLANTLLQLEIVRFDDVNTIEDPVSREFVQSLGYRSLLAIPMQMPSGIIGVIGCSHSTEARCWTDNVVEALQAVMGQLAIALTQADLYTQARTKAQELEQALRELQRTQAQMVQSEKMSSLGQLVAGVAHEINNPVNFIYGNLNHASGYAQDLLNLIKLYQQHYPNPVPEIQKEAAAIDLGFLVEDLPKLLASMRVGADRIQQIVLSLRNFSRMDESEVKSVDIHEGIDSTLMILQSRIKANSKQAKVEVIKQYGSLPLVECYPGQLNQVFMNILSNALDALEENNVELPQIRIKTECIAGDQARVKIADNGCGMTPEQQQRLFDPFFTTKPIGKGTGLGLSISYQIVTEKHGGRLSCFSTPEQGTEFHIEIPLQRVPAP